MNQPTEIEISLIKTDSVLQNRDERATLNKDMERKARNSNTRQLAQSMEREGLRDPILVYLIDGVHTLVSGHHRLEAAMSLKWQTIKANVVTGTREEAYIASKRENLIPSKPLSDAERMQNAWDALSTGETCYYRQLYNESGYAVAEALGISEPSARKMKKVLCILAAKAIEWERDYSFDDNKDLTDSPTEAELWSWWLTYPPLSSPVTEHYDEWWRANKLLTSKGERPMSYQRTVANYERIIMSAVEHEDNRNDEALSEALKNLHNKIRKGGKG